MIRSRKRRKSSIVDWAIVNVLNRLQIQRPHRHDRPDGVSVENDLSTVAFSDPSTMDPRFVAIR